VPRIDVSAPDDAAGSEVRKAMVTVACPWCEMPASVEMMAECDSFRCQECGIEESIEGDDLVAPAAAA
jgi:hypothetical protein